MEQIGIIEQAEEWRDFKCRWGTELQMKSIIIALLSEVKRLREESERFSDERDDAIEVWQDCQKEVRQLQEQSLVYKVALNKYMKAYGDKVEEVERLREELYSTDKISRQWLSIAQTEIKQLKEGIAEVLDGTLPYLAEKKLKELLEVK